MLLLAPVMLVGFGVVAFLVPGSAAVPGMDAVSRWATPPAFPGNTPTVLLAIGVALVALGVATGPVALRGYGGLARLVLAPSREAELELRVEQLAQTRRETLDTGAAELRRIERDLHDGAQARLVAMGLTLDAAGRLIDTDPAAARALLTRPGTRPRRPWRSCATWCAASTRRCSPTGAWPTRSGRWPWTARSGSR